MEEKVLRESKVYVEKMFRKLDRDSLGALGKPDIIKLVESVCPDFKDNLELAELMNASARRNKASRMNPKTKQIEFQYFDNTIDLPAAMAIVVHFLAKNERKQSDAFAGQGLIRFEAMNRRPSSLADNSSGVKKRLY